jgi:tripartite-type tricarboxylate transporter receptor subunit TctC
MGPGADTGGAEVECSRLVPRSCDEVIDRVPGLVRRHDQHPADAAGSAAVFHDDRKIDVVHVPYKGGPEVLADVLAGRIDFYYCPISTAIPFLQDGRLRALAVSTPTRAAALPDVPTSIEAGYSGSDYTVWFGVFMPAKTPDQIVERFYQATTKVLQTPALRERFAQLAVDPWPLTPKQFDQRVADELAANAVVMKAAKIK